MMIFVRFMFYHCFGFWRLQQKDKKASVIFARIQSIVSHQAVKFGLSVFSCLVADHINNTKWGSPPPSWASATTASEKWWLWCTGRTWRWNCGTTSRPCWRSSSPPCCSRPRWPSTLRVVESTHRLFSHLRAFLTNHPCYSSASRECSNNFCTNSLIRSQSHLATFTGIHKTILNFSRTLMILASLLQHPTTWRWLFLPTFIKE